MLKPIFFENDHLIIHPFRPEDMEQFDRLVRDIFAVFSDAHTLKFVPDKRLCNLQEAELFLRALVINFHSGRNYVHFVTSKVLGRVVGLIDLISPEVAREHYRIEHYPYFIEFYLSGFATGCYIMTEILPIIVNIMLDQGIPAIGAVVNRRNIAAKRVLEKANFAYKARFDVMQDLYELTS